jgi:pyruvate/2-oxoglutarate dehydrogenase complex dihydrolipoamide acyltransferase (E2) component
MANRQQLNKIITTISERYNIGIDKLEAIVSNNGSKIISKFASPIAKQKWEESGKANSELFAFPPSHKKGYTLKDVNLALGIEEPIKKVSVWASKTAKEEAEKNNLSEKDFSDILNSMKKISISDVRKATGQEDENTPKKFASPWAKKLAEENGLIGNEDFEKLKGSSKKGKYNVEDVKNFLKQNQV